MNGKHVAVLMGGFSSERPVSLSSGNACADALEGEGYQVTRVDVGHDVAQVLADDRQSASNSLIVISSSTPASCNLLADLWTLFRILLIALNLQYQRFFNHCRKLLVVRLHVNVHSFWSAFFSVLVMLSCSFFAKP